MSTLSTESTFDVSQIVTRDTFKARFREQRKQQELLDKMAQDVIDQQIKDLVPQFQAFIHNAILTQNGSYVLIKKVDYPYIKNCTDHTGLIIASVAPFRKAGWTPKWCKQGFLLDTEEPTYNDESF